MGATKTRITKLVAFSKGYGKKHPLTVDKVHVVKRVDRLQELEGWYEYDQLPPEDHPIYQRLCLDWGSQVVKEALKTKLVGKIRLGRYLAKLGISSDEASKFICLIGKGRFKISCRYNDFLRVAETKHYASCMEGWRGLQLLRDLADPDMVCVYEPDKSGKMKCRMFARLLAVKSVSSFTIFRSQEDVLRGGEIVLGLYRIYGNGFTHQSFVNVMGDRIRCVRLTSARDWDKGKLQLESYSKVHNPAVGKPIWSDHGCKLQKERLQFAGVAV